MRSAINFLNLEHVDIPMDGPLVWPGFGRDILQIGTLAGKFIAIPPVVSFGIF